MEGSSIKLQGKELTTLGDKELCDIRGKDIAMIFQDPMTSLNPVFTIGKQLTETISRHMGVDKKKQRNGQFPYWKRWESLRLMRDFMNIHMNCPVVCARE